jgi:hypothetical protein
MRYTYPPDDFDIRKASDYSNFAMSEAASPLAASVLIHVDEEAKICGNYRIVLGGSVTLKVDVPAKEAIFMGGSDNYRLLLEVWPRDIRIRENMMSSEWFDLEER